MKKPVVDLLIGNKAKCPDGSVAEVPVYRVKSEVAVVTREQKRREEQGFTPPVARPEDLRKEQLGNVTLERCRELAKTGAKIKTGTVGEVSCWTRRVFSCLYQGHDGRYKQVVVPKRLRQGLISVARESMMRAI